MGLDEKKLREYFACYGANVEGWPEHIRDIGCHALHSSQYIAIFEDEKRFEGVLYDGRSIKAPSPHLAQRIIEASYGKEQFRKPQWWLYDMLAGIQPTALAATLVLGFAIGFAAFTPIAHDPGKIFMPTYPDDEGAIL